MNDTEIDALIVDAIKNNKISKQKPQTDLNLQVLKSIKSN